MSSFDHPAPSLNDIDSLARKALAGLPEVFRRHCEGVAIRVADFASDDLMDELGINDPMNLTGLYHGVALTERSIMDPPMQAPVIWLFRRPILDEWVARGDVALDRLVEHVLVHEIAHHFGYSDDDIMAIDDWRL